MSAGAIALGAAIGAIVVFALTQRWRQAQRAEFIRSYTLPMGLFAAMRKRRPELDAKDCQLANRALRQFFLAYLHGGRKFVSMPSQVADKLWHEFILHTRAYQQFCAKAFGGLLHHTPATALGKDRQHNAGLRRCWWHACLDEQINPRLPTRLPLLFALDAKLGIADGFHYSTNCRLAPYQDTGTANDRGGGGGQCAGDFSDSSIDGGTDGFGDSDGGGDGDAGGDGDGGGDGCGGGCGGD